MVLIGWLALAVVFAVTMSWSLVGWAVTEVESRAHGYLTFLIGTLFTFTAIILVIGTIY